MSEINIAAIAKAGDGKVDATPMQELNTALKESKFGKFHIRLLASAFVGVTANMLVSMDTSYILPIAECDLKMDLTKKGALNAMPYFGMIFSSIVAGFLTDTFGRKIFVQVGYGGIFLFTLIAGSSQTYEVLVVAKFFSGVLFAASFNAMVAFTCEFCYTEIRDRVMLCQSSFMAVAQVLIAVFSWAILTQNWHLSLWNGLFVLNIWNFYLYICSLWSCLAFILYTLLPESPKYLISQRKFEQARTVLINVYVENTGKKPEDFPAWSLWRNASKVELSGQFRPLGETFRLGLQNMKLMFKKPLVVYLLLICTLTFFSMLIYNVLRLWFPQLSTIIEHYASKNVHTQSFCAILDSYTVDIKKVSVHNETVCLPKKPGTETYVNSIILGIVCMVPYLVSGILVNRVGKKALLIAGGLLTSCATLILPWIDIKVVIVALFSIEVALTQNMLTLYQTVVVEFFPTNVRSLAIGMMMTSGRLGTLVGNVLFPVFLTLGCLILFYSLAGIIIGVTLMCFLLPRKKK